MNQIELGHRIRQCRKMKHLTQEKLAELISVSPHYIYEVEKGLKSMSLATFIDLCTVLNVSTDYSEPPLYPRRLMTNYLLWMN